MRRPAPSNASTRARTSGNSTSRIRLGQGKSATDIADALHLSVKTVSTYRTRILMKTGFKSNGEIIAYAIRTGLL
jgi:two-component system, NarL family, invasion response regulator UvrY